MGLNKQRGNMYSFVDTWNPLAGKCSHRCNYCYRDRMMRFPKIKAKYNGLPRIDYSTNGIVKNLSKKKYWFVGSMVDVFANDVKTKDIQRIIDQTNRFPKNKYLFQTKNPKRFAEFNFQKNHILCITLETNRWYSQISKAPAPAQRTIDFIDIDHPRKMITIEPIIDFDLNPFVSMIKSIEPEWVNIGADSGGNELDEPPKEKVLELIDELKMFTQVVNKTNLKRILA